MRFLKPLFLTVILLSLKPAYAESLIIKYGEREADLTPYLFAFPYNITAISKKNKKVYYTKDKPTGGSYLYVQPWDGDGLFDINTKNAKQISDVSIDDINFEGQEYNEALDALIIIADEAKRENLNLWLFSEQSPKAVRLTDADYIYSFAQSADQRTVVYTSRYGSSDSDEGCLELLTIANNGMTSTQKLFCDSDHKIPAKLNGWGSLRIDDKYIIFTAQKGGSRTNRWIYRYDRLSGDVTRLAGSSGVVSTWTDENKFLHEFGKELRIYDIVSGSNLSLHKFQNSFRIGAMEIGGQTYLYALTKDVSKTTFEIFRLVKNQLIKTDGFVVDMKAGFVHAEDGTVFLYKQSTDTIVDYEKIDIDQAGRILRNDFIKGLTQLNDQLAQCKISRVTYKSVDHIGGFEIKYDIDAYLYEPRNPIAADNRLYLIEAFYGGQNSFSPAFHSFCQVGITTLSPVVRGDSRFGSAFENSNNGIKADAPIRDVIAGARYLQSKYEFSDSRRIGTMGYSHGGWAAVRALSYPGPEHFEFGFALAGAGIYDILQMADDVPEGKTNIRGWFNKEFGNLDTEREYLSYLSATSHMDRIKAPIFLYHGRNDERITALHTISFAEKLRAANKDHELLIIEGQGHSIRGARNWHEIYGAMFKFLERVNAELK